MSDVIIEELWKIKDIIAAEFGCDAQALAAQLRARKHREDQQTIDLRDMKPTAERDAQAGRQREGGL